MNVADKWLIIDRKLDVDSVMSNSIQIGRREFIGLCTATIGLAAVGDLSGASTNAKAKEMHLYVGTYTSGRSKSKGIYIHKFDGTAGHIARYTVVEGIEEPSFLAIDPKGRFLFAVNETMEFNGELSGSVSSFAIDKNTGDLKFINKVASLGGAPCHITVSGDGNFVLVANYMGGNVAVFPIDSTGKLSSATSTQQHSGSGPQKDRQEAAHAHSIILSPDDKFVFVSDLGIDKIVIYAFDAKTGKLSPNKYQLHYSTEAGAGPRHFKFHPNGRFAVVLNELNMTVSSLAYDGTVGTLKPTHTVSTLAEDFKGENTCADIHFSPDGRFVYASNRGHDSIAVFSFDGSNGHMSGVEIVATGGKTPRNFAIDPSGNFLLVGNQNSDSIVVFSVDRATGRLRNTGKSIGSPRPVCLLLR